MVARLCESKKVCGAADTQLQVFLKHHIKNNVMIKGNVMRDESNNETI